MWAKEIPTPRSTVTLFKLYFYHIASCPKGLTDAPWQLYYAFLVMLVFEQGIFLRMFVRVQFPLQPLIVVKHSDRKRIFAQKKTDSIQIPP